MLSVAFDAARLPAIACAKARPAKISTLGRLIDSLAREITRCAGCQRIVNLPGETVTFSAASWIVCVSR